jgi:hypothetical protein
MEAVHDFIGMLGPGSTSYMAEARAMPDPATVFEYYKSAGTTIAIADLPFDGEGFYLISDALISPAANPYGSRLGNPEGIYAIDCLSQPIHVRNSRVVGTLVLLNPGSGSVIYGSMNWEPAIANYPALLVDGAMNFCLSSTALSEADLDKNFNPLGTPYEALDDSDLLDTYPSVINGLVYVSGDAATDEKLVDAAFAGLPIRSAVNGVTVVGVTFTATQNMDFTYDAKFFNDPPPGFGAGGDVAISPGTWRRVVD